jgi:hypothetical protein
VRLRAEIEVEFDCADEQSGLEVLTELVATSENVVNIIQVAGAARNYAWRVKDVHLSEDA